MSNTIILLVVFIAMALPPHAGHTTFFNIHLDKKPNELVIEMETSYLGWLFNKSAEGVNGEMAVGEYLNEQIKIYFNDEYCSLTVNNIEPDNFGHSFVNAHFNRAENSNIKSLRIENTCFLNKTDEQVNVIMIYQKDKEMRGFRMSKDRIEIDVEL